MAEAYIKLYRKMTNWEWYSDTNTFRVFMHCLLMANWKDGRFLGHEIPRGSFASSYSQIAKQTDLSIQNVRTAFSHLQLTGEITVKSLSKFSIFTVVNYNLYQDGNRVANSQLTFNQQAANSQLTTIEEYKNIRIKENNNTTNAREEDQKRFGIYNNVLLTVSELNELMRLYPDDYKDMIENLSMYMKSKGKLYDDHYATMMRWKHEDENKTKVQKPVKEDFWEEFERIRSKDDDD